VATVTVSHIAGTTYQSRIEGEESAFIADEPVGAGGDGMGPSPYELLLAGLAHCTVLTILLYARRKEWEVAGVTVRASHERLVIEDESEGELRRRKVERITQQISLEGNLDEFQRARLMEIAGKCPVHRTLTGELEIVEVEVPSPTIAVVVGL
jgi:putative redox protein